MVLDAGGLEASDRPAGAAAALDVPPTIHALLSARLDRLDPDERTIIGCASVIGRQFGWSGVTALAPPALRPRVASSLQALVRKRMVLPDRPTALGEDAFRFSHILMQDAAYRALPRSHAAELHERFAGWLDERAGAGSGEYAEILGYHLERAAAARRQVAPRDGRAVELAGRAGVLLAAAGGRALARDDVPAATSLLERAVVLLAADGPPLFGALLDLAQALRERGELGRAEAVVEQALDRARALARPELVARARIEQSWLRMILDPHVEARQLLQVAEEAAAICESERDELGLARAWIHVGDAHWMRCRFVDMERVMERALVHAEAVGAQREISAAVSGLVRCALVGPRAVSAAIERVLRLRDRLPGRRPALSGEVEFILGALEAMRGRAHEARAHLDAGTRALEGFGLNIRFASLRLYGAWVELSNGDPEAAERELRPGYESLKEMGEHAYLSTLAGMLAQTLYELGRFDESADVAAVGTTSASRDDIVSHVFLRGTLAKLAARRGDVEPAVRLAEEAVALARTTDFVDLTAGALGDLGEVLMLSGRPRDGAAAFAQAIVLYEVKENLAAVRRARTRRDELAAAS
jgi:tetratricopeptide (TPR) repeat protein